MKIKGKTYKMRVNYQLKEWVNGNSIHNEIDDECCPDFSCCKPEFLISKEEREAFVNANDDQKECMLYGFLGTAIGAITDKNILIIDGKNEINSTLN